MNIEELRREFKTISKYENVIWKKGKNEREAFQRFEFLGDKVLAIILSSEIFTRYKNYNEGKLSRVVAYLCSGKVLAKIALELKLDLYLKAKKRIISDKVLVDSLETIIGIFYFSNGFDKTKNIIDNLWKNKMKNIQSIGRDNKTLLQEWSQAKKLGLPKYTLVSKDGPAHNPVFTVKVEIANLNNRDGKGKTLQDAEQKAAKQFLKYINTKNEKETIKNY